MNTLQVLQDYEEVRTADPTIFSTQVMQLLLGGQFWLCFAVSVSLVA